MIAKGIYKHFKGNEYRVIDTATHSETMEVMVIYKPLYNDSGLWVRPLDMFLEKIQHNGELVNRFTFFIE